MKKYIVYIIIILILIGGIIVLLLKQNKANYVKDNELILNEFEYIYDGTVSHICPVVEETISFNYNEFVMTISAQKKTFNEGIGQSKEDYPNCINKELLTNIYSKSEGITTKLDNCEILEQIPSSSNNPEYLKADCDSNMQFRIFNQEKFNSCKIGGCNLINGVDVQPLN